ncbi:MAG: SAF domain-containing protein [Acidimicrobiia bacterium]
MLVLSRPPYLRWLAAVALLAGAFAWDLSKGAAEPAPFAATTIERGTVIEASMIEWRQVPVGLLPAVELTGVAATRIDRGEPIVASALSTAASIPIGWWTVPMDVPPAATPGASVRIVLADGFGVVGRVVEASRDDPFGMREPGLVAVPHEAADMVALAAASNQVVLLFGQQ